MVTVVVAVVLGPLVSTLGVARYFADRGWWDYINGTLRFSDHQWGLPGVFATTPWPTAVNGSVWTLPAEVACYVAVALAGVLGLRRARPLVPVGALAVAAVLLLPHGDLLSDYAGPVAAFAIGAAATSAPPRRRVPALVLLLAVAVLWAATRSTPAAASTTTSAVAVATLVLAFHLPTRWGHPTGSWDLSYGLYLLSFPTQQTLAWGGVRSPWAVLALTLAVDVPAAAAAWRLVERPALRWKPRHPARRPVTIPSPRDGADRRPVPVGP